jgi:hypothetical protein
VARRINRLLNGKSRNGPKLSPGQAPADPPRRAGGHVPHLARLPGSRAPDRELDDWLVHKAGLCWTRAPCSARAGRASAHEHRLPEGGPT